MKALLSLQFACTQVFSLALYSVLLWEGQWWHWLGIVLFNPFVQLLHHLAHSCNWRATPFCGLTEIALEMQKSKSLWPIFYILRSHQTAVFGSFFFFWHEFGRSRTKRWVMPTQSPKLLSNRKKKDLPFVTLVVTATFGFLELNGDVWFLNKKSSADLHWYHRKCPPRCPKDLFVVETGTLLLSSLGPAAASWYKHLISALSGFPTNAKWISTPGRISYEAVDKICLL